MLEFFVQYFRQAVPTGRDTLRSDRKPTWLAPYIIIVIALVLRQYLILDIQLNDRISLMEAQSAPGQQIEAAQS
jgi:hypothetical protein